MEIFNENNIILDATPKSKTDAIKMCGQVLLNNGYVRPEYIEDMLEREKLITTYVGNHASIPHGLSNSSENILHSGISFVQVPNGVEFGTAEESKIAYIIIGIAGKNGEHLDILGNLALILTDMKNVEKIKNATKKSEIVQIFQSI